VFHGSAMTYDYKCWLFAYLGVFVPGVCLLASLSFSFSIASRFHVARPLVLLPVGRLRDTRLHYD